MTSDNDGILLSRVACHSRKMLRVGLTGSIAVGKSFVSATLAELGCHVLDADATAREVVEHGAPGLEKIVQSFGATMLNSDGTLDRTKLGNLVFANVEKRQLLNSILHPYCGTGQEVDRLGSS